jgi:hypothetical protein
MQAQDTEETQPPETIKEPSDANPTAPGAVIEIHIAEEDKSELSRKV